MTDCGCDNETTIPIFACSGGCNVGQLANQAAVELAADDFGQMFCLAGLGVGNEALMNRVRQAGVTLVLDGCPAACARAVFERAGVPLTGYVMVTDHGVEKRADLSEAVDPDELARVKVAAKSAVAFCRQVMRGPSTCCFWPEGDL